MGLEAGPRERLDDWLRSGIEWVEGSLGASLQELDSAPQQLRSAMSHALMAGGKRLRPTLVRYFAGVAGGDDESARMPAIAIEMVHTYSLVHDDLPCMDDDDLRRGIPTVHKRWDEATAVLAGDALLTQAFALLAQHDEAAALVGVLAEASGPAGMVGGQVLDLTVALDPAAFEGAQEAARAVEEVHSLKTAALFRAACELGWIAGGGDSGRRMAARTYGHALGLLFQATDDLIDVTGSAEGLGKTPGKDAALQRPTLVAALGMEGATERAQALASEAREAALALGLGDGTVAVDLVSHLLNRAH